MALQEEPAVDAAVENSVEFLRDHTKGCRFARADIAGLAKRLSAGESLPMPANDDAAGLKVEKNALAIIFIPAIFALAEQVLAPRPGMVFFLHDGRLQSSEARPVREALDPGMTQAGLCQLVFRSLSNVFDFVSTFYVEGLKRTAAETGVPLLERYEGALNDYHTHTKETLDFTPTLHFMAGIHTALFFILRALSAISTLGERRLGRPVTETELSAAVKLNAPLLLAIARCHLSQLLALEPLLGKCEDKFLTRLDKEAYADQLAAMFTLAADGWRLELSPAVRDALPRALESDRPRTSCPALFTATGGTENAIVTLVRLVETAFIGVGR
jgi:hypothetical protein